MPAASAVRAPFPDPPAPGIFRRHGQQFCGAQMDVRGMVCFVPPDLRQRSARSGATGRILVISSRSRPLRGSNSQHNTIAQIVSPVGCGERCCRHNANNVRAARQALNAYRIGGMPPGPGFRCPVTIHPYRMTAWEFFMLLDLPFVTKGSNCAHRCGSGGGADSLQNCKKRALFPAWKKAPLEAGIFYRAVMTASLVIPARSMEAMALATEP